MARLFLSSDIDNYLKCERETEESQIHLTCPHCQTVNYYKNGKCYDYTCGFCKEIFVKGEDYEL